jgi:hypothetical protein
VGVGVGSALGVALIAAISWLAWILHRKSRSKLRNDNHDQTEPSYQEAVQQYPKNPDSSSSPSHRSLRYKDHQVHEAEAYNIHEAEAHNIHEAEAYDRIHEAEAQLKPKVERYELPTGK